MISKEDILLFLCIMELKRMRKEVEDRNKKRYTMGGYKWILNKNLEQ